MRFLTRMKRHGQQKGRDGRRSIRSATSASIIIISGRNVVEAYCRTLLLDNALRTPERFNSETLRAFFNSIVPEANDDMMKPTPTEQRRLRLLREADELDKILRQTVPNRRLFLTTEGYMGLGPVQMEIGDKVCIGFGYPAPLVLRKNEGQGILIGECYTHGIMDGEAVGLINGGELYSEIFDIK
jgi:hypothetical protein